MAKGKRSVANGGTTRVRTTFNPDKVIEVDAAELLDLERQGLIVDEAPASKAKKTDAPPAGGVIDTPPAGVGDKDADPDGDKEGGA